MTLVTSSLGDFVGDGDDLARGDLNVADLCFRDRGLSSMRMSPLLVTKGRKYNWVPVSSELDGLVVAVSVEVVLM